MVLIFQSGISQNIKYAIMSGFCKSGHIMISALDTKILEAIENDEEIEAEILQAEEITSLISMAKAKITSHLLLLAELHKPTQYQPLPPNATQNMKKSLIFLGWTFRSLLGLL